MDRIIEKKKGWRVAFTKKALPWWLGALLLAFVIYLIVRPNNKTLRVDKDNDNVIELTEQNSDASARYWYCWYGWITGGLATTKTPGGYPANFGEMLLARNTTAVSSSHMGFAFDATNVQNELAACNAIYESTYKILKLGQEDNYEDIIADANKKLYESGLQVLIDEAQKQLDEYKKAAGK